MAAGDHGDATELRDDPALRTPARFTVSGRRITMTTGGASVHWRMLARRLATLHGPTG